MNKKIKIEIAIGIILIVAIIIGGSIWFINKKQDQWSTISGSNQKNESKTQNCNKLSQSDLERIWNFELKDQNNIDIINEITFKASTDAAMYYDEKETYTGFSLNKKLNIPSCSSKPIVQISPDGQGIAFYSKMCTRNDMFICVDMEKTGSPEYGLVCDDYIQLNKATCPKKINEPTIKTDNNVNAINKDALLSMIKIKGAIKCIINSGNQKTTMITDGRRSRVEYLINYYDPPGQKINTKEDRSTYVNDGTWLYDWYDSNKNVGNKYKLTDEEKLGGTIDFEGFSKMQNSCVPIEINESDFMSPNNIKFEIDDNGSTSF